MTSFLIVKRLSLLITHKIFINIFLYIFPGVRIIITRGVLRIN